MINLAIGILWVALGVVILGAIIYVALWAVRQFVPIPPKVETAIWAVFVILVLIYLLSTVAGGGLPHPSFFHTGGMPSSNAAAGPAYLRGMLT